MIFTLAVLIVAFGIARNLGQRLNRLLVGVSALALLGFGIHQILRGLG
jgi:hypothetical protein